MKIAGKAVNMAGTTPGPVVIGKKPEMVGAYFLKQTDVEYIPSGAEVLDCILGGGWANQRFINIIGDSSTGKTGLAIEALINFKKIFPKAMARICEPEAAFGRNYAKELGLPLKEIEFTEDDSDIDTVEGWAADMEAWFANLKAKKRNGIYVLDSLDSLSDDAEMEREYTDKTFAMSKAKKVGEIFRRIIRNLKATNSMLIVISQTRDNINATFGRKVRRACEKPLEFYSSQVIWLAHLGGIERQISGVKREIGRNVRVNCSKNKAGVPHRQCEIQFRYGFGLDDLASNLKFLASVGQTQLAVPGLNSDKMQGFINGLDQKPDHEYRALKERVAKLVPEVWREVEQAFLPSRRKYK